MNTTKTPRPTRRTLLVVGFMLLSCAPVVLAAGPQKTDSLQEAQFLQVDTAGRPGGRLVVALRAEPVTFNPLLATDQASFTVIRGMMADLVHINRVSQKTEPSLARQWTLSGDGLTYRVELRRGILFSDGHELDADDVVFTFQVYLDEAVASPHRHLLVVADQPIVVRRLDRFTVELKLAKPYAVGDRLFDSLPILPEHRLRGAYAAGKIADVWGVGTPPEEIVGLGPFQLASYLPGQRLVLRRNPNYWKVDGEGHRLPYLDELVFLFVADEDAQLLRFQAGDTHVIDGFDAESYAVLEREQARRGYVLEDLGAGLVSHFLFFNLNDLDASLRPEIARKQKWFRNLVFRQAIDAAIDRQSMIRLAYRGRATALASPVSAGNKLWGNTALRPVLASVERSRELLRKGGFSWDAAGRLLDGDGEAVRLTLLTNSSNDERVRMASIIEEDLRRLGMAVQFVPLEFRALLERLTESYDYEMCILGVSSGDADPNGLMNLMMSGGSNHLWRLGDVPAGSPWQEEIDRLLQEQLVTIDPVRRKALFDRIQVLFAENLPLIPLVSPNVLVGAQRDLGNFKPAILQHSTLWNVDELFWRTPRN